jgi:hypothetical protein
VRVFISWSGESSKALARCFNNWLPRVLQATEPWFSEEAVAPGSRWLQELITNLRAQDFFVACVTPESLASAWFNFEVGIAASKLLGDEGKQRLCPILWKLDNRDIRQPLAMFQTLSTSEGDIRKLVTEMNNRLERGLSPADLEASFQKWWPDLARCLETIPDESNPATARRPEDILDEILATVRQQSISSNSAILTLARIEEDISQVRTATGPNLSSILRGYTPHMPDANSLNATLQLILDSARSKPVKDAAGLGEPPVISLGEPPTSTDVGINYRDLGMPPDVH